MTQNDKEIQKQHINWNCGWGFGDPLHGGGDMVA